MKRIKKIIELDNLKEWYIYANTPMYLYKHFREEGSLRNLSEKLDVSELTEIYNHYRASKKQNLENVVISYAVLTALTLKDPYLAEKAFKKIDLSCLRWGNDIRDIFKKNITKYNFYNLNVSRLAKISVPSAGESGKSSRFTFKAKKQKIGKNSQQFTSNPASANYNEVIIARERDDND